MAWVIPAAGDRILASHVSQIIKALNGTASFAQAVALTKLSSSDYSLDVQNLSTTALTGGRALRVLDPSSNVYIRTGFATDAAGNRTIYHTYMQNGLTIGSTDYTHANNPGLIIKHYDYTGSPTAGQSYAPLAVEAIYANLPTDGYGGVASIPDSAAISGVIRIVNQVYGAAQDGDVSARALEGQAFAYDDVGPRSISGAEVGVHVAVDWDSHADNSGAYDTFFGTAGMQVISTGGGGTGFTTTYQANHGIVFWGDGGFKNFLTMYDTSQVLVMRIDSSGNIRGNYSSGTPGSRASFQSLAASSDTLVNIRPNNTTGVGALHLFGQSDMNNADYGYVSMSGGNYLEIGTNNSGTGSDRAIRISPAGTLATSWATTGNATFSMAVALSIISPSQITGNQNDYAPTGYATASIWRLSSDASRNITGISATGITSGQFITIVNVGGADIVLTNNDAASSAANRMILTGAANITLTPGDAAELFYDGSSWRMKSGK